jgi:hypothetical protein
MKGLFSLKSLGSATLAILVLALTLTAGAAQAATSASCPYASFSQPFLPYGDFNYYVAPEGVSYDNVSGAGWTLSGGAKLLTTTLADRGTGQVLDLPSGSKAVSPVICVTSEYPTARGIVRNVKGSGGVYFYVEYEGTNTWGHPKNTGQIHGNGTEWTLATPVNMQPYNVSGLQPMRISLVPGGTTSDFQVYNLYVDPRMR